MTATELELCGQATRAQGSYNWTEQQWFYLESLRLIKGIVESDKNGIITTDVLKLLLQQRYGGDCQDFKHRCVTEEIGSRVEKKSQANSEVSCFQELLQQVRRSSLMMATESDYYLLTFSLQPLMKKIVLRIAQSGKYNVHTKEFESTMKQAYESWGQSSGESTDVFADAEEVARHLEILRKKLNQPGWHFGRIYLDVFDGQDIAGIFKATKPVVKEERDLHKHLAFYTSVDIIGRRRNMTGTRSTDDVPSVAPDESFYYIGEGIVQCTGRASACICEQGKVAVVVKKMYKPESDLRHASVPQALPSFEAQGVLEIDEIIEWPEQLLQIRGAEDETNNRTESKATKSSKTEVRELTRLPRRSQNADNIVSPVSFGKKTSKKRRGRKDKSTLVQVVSKPETVQVTTKSGRKARKLVK